jgi:hypothetical protein
MTTPRSRSMSIRWTARAALLAVGLIVVTIALVELIDVQLALNKISPWSYLGLFGLAAVVLALGSPWSSHIGDD